jgi:transcription initiation factor IIE alpha subunit
LQTESIRLLNKLTEERFIIYRKRVLEKNILKFRCCSKPYNVATYDG